MTSASASTAPLPSAPAGRDPALDLLRTVALGRVVLWHAFAASWMTFFAAMPVMFFVAGTLLAPPPGRRSHLALVRRRARRILVPLWIYAAVVLTAGVLRHPPGWEAVASVPDGLAKALTWIVPLVDPAGADWHGGWLSTHLWYLRAYLWVLLLVPLLLVLSRHLRTALPLLAAAVAGLEIAGRVGVPLIGVGPARVLVGDAVTYGLFVVLGMAYRRRTRSLPRRKLALGAVAAGGATAAYVVVAGLPSGGVNDSYAAVGCTGLAWLLAAGAAEGPIRWLAERPGVRRTTAAVTGRAVTIYLWHPVAIVVAYAALKGWDRWPQMTVVQRWPAPAVTVVALTVLSTALAVAAIGWVEDLAARRPATDRRRRRVPAGPRPGTRLARLATVVPSAAATVAFTVPVLVVPVADGDATASAVSVPRPPSFRAALANDAFAGRRQPDTDGTAPLRGVHSARAALGRSLSGWLSRQPHIEAVAVAVAVDGQVWTGTAHKKKAPARLKVDDEFAALSMTKTFTTALVLHEVDAGRLSLDSPVPRLQGLRVRGDAARITVRHLLSHTSGLSDYAAVPGFDPAAPIDARRAVQLALGAGLRKAPGAEVHYSNTNFQYLGLILEHVTGRPYADLLAELTAAHGLARTRLAPGGPGWPAFSSGGIVSTLGDLVRWGEGLFTPGQVVQPAWADPLTTLDDLNMALSMWPLCPCATGDDGTKHYTAIGQTVGYGGLVRFPSGMTMVMRADPHFQPLDEGIVSLGQALETALRRA
jgi:CubicO group peptidase (beta-lactamase class C family)/peptidoglycan/LPS O-acetylase OafA/YrhL